MKAKLCMNLALGFLSTGVASKAFSFTDEGARFSQSLAYNVINQNSNLCLAIANGSYAEKAMVVQTSDCESYAAQWNYVNRGNGWFSIRNNNSGLCLAIKDGSGKIGTPAVQVSNCDSTAAQWVGVWYQAYVRFYVRHSGLCLGIENGSDVEGAIAVQTNTCESRPAQWAIKDLMI